VKGEEEEDVEQSFQPDLFGRHDPCKARLAPPKTQVKTALAGPCGRGQIFDDFVAVLTTLWHCNTL